jgi:hypothetical protein
MKAAIRRWGGREASEAAPKSRMSLREEDRISRTCLKTQRHSFDQQETVL